MPGDAAERAQTHAARFNAAVESGDWSTFVSGFTPDASMTFVGVPVGPFDGREAILAAYLSDPPEGGITVTSVETAQGMDRVGVDWSTGGRGRMDIRWRDGLVESLAITFL